MEIIISNSSTSPIYEQISRQIKDQILQGGAEGGGRPAFHADVGKGAAHQPHHHQAGV